MRLLITGASGFIGTNLIETVRNNSQYTGILNVDIRPPNINAHLPFWTKCDVMHLDNLKTVVQDFSPDQVVHMAAKTDTNSDTLADYEANTIGTENVINCLKSSPSIKRFILTSTQFVCGPKRLPRHEMDFFPHTTYGESKVMNEKGLRSARLMCTWTIIRPTNIWGPWHPRYPYEFLRVLQKNLYFHPGRQPVVRSYGYVENVVHQIINILTAKSIVVDRKVFYVGDPPDNIYAWVNGFSMAITGKPVRIIPRPLLRALAWGGDALRIAGIRAPIFSSRYRSMTTDYETPMQNTFNIFGHPPYTLEHGIAATMHWLREQKHV